MGKIYYHDTTLTSSASAHEPQIVKFGHLVLHQGGAVAQLRAKVFIVARANGNRRAIWHLAERHHLEGNRQRLVGPPVRGQHCAHDVRATGADQLAGVFGQEAVQRPFGQHVSLEETVAVPHRFRQVHVQR